MANKIAQYKLDQIGKTVGSYTIIGIEKLYNGWGLKCQCACGNNALITPNFQKYKDGIPNECKKCAAKKIGKKKTIHSHTILKKHCRLERTISHEYQE